MAHLSYDQTTLTLLGIAALGVAILVAFGWLILASVGTRRRVQQALERMLEQLELTRCELRDHAQLIEQLESRSRVQDIGAGNAKAIDAAVRMARTGASSDQLAANSGLTRQEARLLARLHGPERAPTAH